MGIGKWSGRRARRAVALFGATIIAATMIAPSVSAEEPVPPSEKDPMSGVVTWSAAEDGQAGILGGGAPGQSGANYVALATGCRMLDTRVAGGAFTAGQFRDVSVLDGDLPVGLGPCGVPEHAIAVSISLSTLNTTPTGTGFARVGPGGQAPQATVLQFKKGVGISVTTDVALDGASQFRLQSFGAGSGYVVDLLGYWETPIWGTVGLDGTLIDGSGIVEIVKGDFFLGDYTVFFDRLIGPGCAPATSMYGDVITTREFSYGEDDWWFFDVRDYITTNEADGGFSFVMNCT